MADNKCLIVIPRNVSFGAEFYASYSLVCFFLRRRISAIETVVRSKSSSSPADSGGRVLATVEVDAMSSSMLCAFGKVGAGGEAGFGLVSCGSSLSREVIGRCR